MSMDSTNWNLAYSEKESWECIGKALRVDLGRGEGVGGEYDQIYASQICNPPKLIKTRFRK